jgi:hypothetical protein
MAESGRVARPLRWVLRGVVTVHLGAVAGQVLLAGRFLAGDYDLLGVHATNGIVVTVLGWVQVLVAVLYWHPGGGPAWPLVACVGLALAEPLQVVLGFSRGIGVHVPLGVAIVVAAVLLAIGVWRPAFGTRWPIPAGEAG